YETQKIRGVNLGGWLHRLKPSLFEATGNPSIVDEWSFCESQDLEKATQALKHDWDTCITEAEFRDI
ncbi:glycoside hydrolase family 5 protein, partial [Laccaria amethystina LaAM-08-1]